jgi:hypothetical protein
MNEQATPSKREQYLQWVRERAIKEMDFYLQDGQSLSARIGALGTAIGSIQSDLTKDASTANDKELRQKAHQVSIALTQGIIVTREQMVALINEFV